MNSQTKFLISMLFIVVIILCVVLTRFYFDVTKNTENSTRENRVESVVRSFGDIQVFRSDGGSYGLLNADLSVLVEPDWLEILDVTEKLVLVSARMDNQVLTGGIDYEENIILPFVFRSFQDLGDGWHLGTVAEDGRCIVYDKNYQPVFQESFVSVTYENHVMTLRNETEQFVYDMTDSVPVLQSAEFGFPVSDTLSLNWKISNRFYLLSLSAADLRRINQIAADYLQMLRENNFRNLAQVTTSEYFSTLVKSDIMRGLEPESISNFSFSRRESGAYDFTFQIACRRAQERKELKLHLYLRKNAENQMILTVADISSAAEE